MVELGAAVLAALGGRFLVVGSGAELLLGDGVTPGDLDVVADPADGGSTRRALAQIALERLPDGDELLGVPTTFGPVDLLAGRWHEEWDVLAAGATTVEVDGVPVPVVSRHDLERLRRGFRRG